jgi:hypothetical protein
MSKIGKYKLKIAVRMFQLLEKWLEENNYDMDGVYQDYETVEQLYLYIEGTLALGNQDDIEFFIAAFHDNYEACKGDWSKLGNEVSPITPKKQKYSIEQSFTQTSIVYEKATIDSYMPSIVKWDSYEGNLDWEIIDEDIRDTFDYDIEDIYVED